MGYSDSPSPRSTQCSGAHLRVCRDYSATVNSQLESHCHPLPLCEELMQRLGSAFGFRKIDLADVHKRNLISSRIMQTLSVKHASNSFIKRCFALQNFFAPGYLQKIMDDITKDLPGVAVYLYDILVGGKNAEDRLHNLKQLLERLSKNGLGCRKRNVSSQNRMWNTWVTFFLNKEFLKVPRYMQS